MCFLTKRSTNFIAQLGYKGPGWHHRSQVEWLLHAGVIDWGSISHTLTASSHLPHDILAGPLLKMEAAWETRQLAKESVNSLIGLWCLDEASNHTLRSSTVTDTTLTPPTTYSAPLSVLPVVVTTLSH